MADEIIPTPEKKGIFNIDFNKIEFRTNWASGSLIVGLLVYVIMLSSDNKTLKDGQAELKAENKELRSTQTGLLISVGILDGCKAQLERANDEILKNSPADLKRRIENLEKINGVDNTSVKINKPFINKIPSKLK
jgi:hypothetical protein